ncbi:hypothetical protein ACFL27_16100 [candidate division CSSED10-310 bacterium]|uniref:Uncharacterized protein n=1 Tax=candidate division CSSED10-310 bacterium TaxID=2855610 RepID=A0ABV6Z054_UNCC1
MELTINDEKSRKMFKELMIELIIERKDLFHEIIVEAMEDIAMGKAIAEGRKNEFVNEEKIMELLEE